MPTHWHCESFLKLQKGRVGLKTWTSLAPEQFFVSYLFNQVLTTRLVQWLGWVFENQRKKERKKERKIGDWDLFRGPLEWVRVETGGDLTDGLIGCYSEGILRACPGKLSKFCLPLTFPGPNLVQNGPQNFKIRKGTETSVLFWRCNALTLQHSAAQCNTLPKQIETSRPVSTCQCRVWDLNCSNSGVTLPCKKLQDWEAWNGRQNTTYCTPRHILKKTVLSRIHVPWHCCSLKSSKGLNSGGGRPKKGGPGFYKSLIQIKLLGWGPCMRNQSFKLFGTRPRGNLGEIEVHRLVASFWDRLVLFRCGVYNQLLWEWAGDYDSSHWIWYLAEIHQFEKPEFLGTNLEWTKILIQICSAIYRGM